MCLIYVAWRCHSRYHLVVAANRDEYHARPAAPAHWWDDTPGLLGGRDLTAGGTWLGVDSTGRFAALTNCQGPSAHGSVRAYKRLSTVERAFRSLKT